MKTITQIIILAIFIIILGAGIFSYIRMFDKLNAYKDNTEQLLNDIPDKIISLTKSDFKEYQKSLNDTLFNKIKDSLNIKFKHIERTINHKYSYTYDTTVTVLISHENGKESYFKKRFDNCLSLEGRIIDTLIYFDKVEIDYAAKTVYYWKRKKKILGIPFGRKQYFSLTENNCSGLTETQEINIIKD